MELVNEMKLYHIQRNKKWPGDNWSIGNELVVGNRHNKFMGSRFTVDYGMPFELDLKEKINKGLTPIEISDIEITWKEYIIKTREYIFELERVKLNHNLPSRFTCLFLTDKHGLDYWKQKLGLSNEHSFYELTVTGNIHKANQKYLETGTKSQEYYHELARKYWSGEEANGEGSEFLFEGKARVTGIL